MNDIHMLVRNPESRNIDSFWKNHPELRIGPSEKAPAMRDRRTAALMQDYLQPQIRQHYLSVLEELTERYDIDGLEFDFMRAPCYFSPDRMEEGTAAMTGFVREVRAMLDRWGEKRGKRLELSARLPNTPEKALSIGLDVETWVREGLVEILNINSDSLNLSYNLDIEGYRAIAPTALILAEMQQQVAPMKNLGYYGRRFTTTEMYRTFAQNHLSRGADGLSLFNFVFHRQHDYYDPRRRMYRNPEPPFGALKNILDLETLKKEPKHYYYGKDTFTQDPLFRRAELQFDPFDDKTDASHAVLRVETDEMCTGIQMDVKLNGEPLQEFTDTGELFRPFTIEALPINEQIRFFEVPLTLLKETGNVLNVECLDSPLRPIIYLGFELAIYR